VNEATFSAPPGPTQGLQGYALDRGPKELYPATMAGLLSRLRRTIAARRKAKRGALKKDNPMTTAIATSLPDFLTTLQASVTDILAKAAPDQRDALLKQTFDEFGTELGKAIGTSFEEELAKGAPLGPEREEDPLLKGLGCVGRIAQLVQGLAEQARNIKEGRNLYAYISTDSKDAPKPDDPASEEVGDLLDGMLRLGEMALRAAVNEHVVVADDGDDEDNLPEGHRLVLVPSADDPGDERLAIVVKTALPEDLAKFAIDPALLDEMRIEAGAILLAHGGVDSDSLEKFLGGEELAKADGVDGEGGEMGMEEEPTDPIDIIGRLAAAIVLQTSALKDALDGDGGEMGDGGQDAEGAEGAEGAGGDGAGKPPMPPEGGEGAEGGGDDEDPEKKGLGKGAGLGASDGTGEGPKPTYDQLLKMLQGLAPELKKLADQPAAPKGSVMAVPKSADGAAGGATRATPEEAAAALEELRKRDPDAALHQTIKGQLALPVNA
jgi:hypothetical protein